MGNKAAAGKAGRLGLLLTIGAVSAAIFAVGWALDRYWLPHQYVFDPEVLGRLAKANVAKYGDDATQLVPSLVADLREAYGDIVNEYNPEHWIINNAGGAMVGGAARCMAQFRTNRDRASCSSSTRPSPSTSSSSELL